MTITSTSIVTLARPYADAETLTISFYFIDVYISIKISRFSGIVRLFLWKWYIFVFDNWIYNLIMCSWEKINLLSSEEGSLQLWWKYHYSKNNILLDIITFYYCTVSSFVSVPPAPKFECSQNHKVNSSNLPTQKSFLKTCFLTMQFTSILILHCPRS